MDKRGRRGGRQCIEAGLGGIFRLLCKDIGGITGSVRKASNGELLCAMAGMDGLGCVV